MEKARRATIKLAGIELEVFMKPSGEYVMSQSQVAEAVDRDEKIIRRTLLKENWLESLPDKAGIVGHLEVVKLQTGQVGNPSINVVPLAIASKFWLAQSAKGNIKAMALADACMQESLQRRADDAFALTRAEDEYEQITKTIVRDWWIHRENLRYAHYGFQKACMACGFNGAQAHDMLTQAITGCTAKEHRLLELIGDSGEVGLDHLASSPVLRRIQYAKMMFAGRTKGTLDERIKKAVTLTYRAGY
jgi:hypothetical protein